jgi:two-component system, NtrC family, sensor kinase
VHILVKPDFKQYVLNTPDLNHQVDFVFQPKSNYDCLIGDEVMFRTLLSSAYPALKSVTHKLLLVNKNESIDLELFSQIQPSVVLDHSELDQISAKLSEAAKENQKKQQALQARENVEAKRNELEKLNEFLSYQDKERSTALKIFHAEEQSKKQYEKQLLFFLDFINSNYTKSSFLDELLQYIWTEIKKIGQFYQLGVIIRLDGDDQAILFQYDDRKYYSQKNITFDHAAEVDSNQLACFLANIYQRPVGKILSWRESNQSENSKVQFYIYLETQGKEYKAPLVESFISDRLSMLSLIISRWVTEDSEKVLLRQWRNTFKAYKDPIHVIDEEFNIIQSNYLAQSERSGKCYEILAHRMAQCVNCPLVTRTNTPVEINSVEYQIHATEFTVDKKYHLLFYEDITEISTLKSQFIQSEKMNTIGNLANHLAHELNNPLTGLKLTTEYLMSEINALPLEASHANLVNDLNEIFKATVRSEMIIKDLVDFSSSSSKEMQQIDFSLVLKKTMTLLKSVLRSNRVFIDVKSDLVHAQPVYLQQVIFNLIKNACEAMGAHGSIKIYHGEPNNEHSDFIIEDNGPGFSESAQVNLFKPFFTTKKEGEGTGLGLYLCSTLMNKMNGQLIFDHKFKSGTRFILRFKN